MFPRTGVHAAHPGSLLTRGLIHVGRGARGLRRGDRDRVRAINRQAEAFRSLEESGLNRRLDDLRQPAAAGMLRESARIEAFALVKEAARRAVGAELYDVQLMAGLVLARGGVAEMATGEGKTLAATLPAVLHALAGCGVHVMTVNEYLAGRDCEHTRPIYQLLGLSAGRIATGQAFEDKRAAYDCDITYGAGPEFGFDYLRDRLALDSVSQAPWGRRFRDRMRGERSEPVLRCQRGRAAAIIDEADSVLVDEARSALILSSSTGRPAGNPAIYVRADSLAAMLEPEVDFVLDTTARTVQLTEPGVSRIFEGDWQSFGPRRPWKTYVEKALFARRLLARDVHYVVDADRVCIIDELTGRRFEDRSWSNGLHQAVEAKEGATITEESEATLRVSRQRFFQAYDSLCGMTGTARGCERELWRFHRLPVVRVPLRTASRRQHYPTVFFRSMANKWAAIERSILEIHRTGRPVLVGTRDIQSSERLAGRLDALGLPHRLLNAKQDRHEAETISAAGQRSAVTIATNMAGRGADIPLGPGVAALGGLHVIAVEPNEVRRIDRQLAGRAGRQGDPGSFQLFVSADDDVLQRHAPELGRLLKARAGVERGSASVELSRRLGRVQSRIEAAHFAQRKALHRRDEWAERVARKAG